MERLSTLTESNTASIREINGAVRDLDTAASELHLLIKHFEKSLSRHPETALPPRRKRRLVAVALLVGVLEFVVRDSAVMVGVQALEVAPQRLIAPQFTT